MDRDVSSEPAMSLSTCSPIDDAWVRESQNGRLRLSWMPKALRARPNSHPHSHKLPQTKQQRLKTAVWTILFSCGLLTGSAAASLATASPAPEVKLKIGIVQRFGTKPTDKLKLQAVPGDRLTLAFKTGNTPQTLQANSVEIDVVKQALAAPRVDERVVLGNYRNFETAENGAEQWQAQGLETEIAQLRRWQVWAKRDTYSTPLLRRLLYQSLQQRGVTSAYLETQVLNEVHRASWVVNGFRYTRDDLEITAGKNLIRVDKKLFSDKLRLQPNAHGTYTLVNEVPIETYLRGVVPHEIGPSAPYAAVEAQAILARTYALRNLRRFVIDDYELCATVHCQVYWGLGRTVSRADRAIAATQGQVLTYNNELADALYSSTTGGITAPFSNIWEGEDRPYLRTIVDSSNTIWDLSTHTLADEQNFRKFINLKQGFNELGWPTFRWRRESSLEKMTRDLQRYLELNKNPLASLKTIQQVAIAERFPSGRIRKLVVQTDKGPIELYKDDIRSAFAAPRSTLFYLEPLNKGQENLWGYAFVGGGFGHGVGLSQTGSYRLAKLGWSSGQILSFYYPGTQIQPLNESTVLWQDGSTLATRQQQLGEREQGMGNREQ